MKVDRKYLLTGAVAVIAVLAVLLKYWDYINNPWTRDGQVRAEVVQITPRVSGPITHLAVRDNQLVKTGDLLFNIDSRTFEANLFQAQAGYDKSLDDYHAQEKQVEAAVAQVEVAHATVLQAKSSIKEMVSTIRKNKAEYERQKQLLPERATSKKSVERARANYEVSREQRQGGLAGLKQAHASLTQAEASLAEEKAKLGAPGDDNANIRAAKATLDQAKLNLEFTEVRAPVDGYITNLTLQIGSQAVANQPFMALIDMNSFWVHGFFRENYISEINKGDISIVTLMTYPGTPIEGVVDSIGWGVSQQDGSTGYELLPTINPTFEWIRLAQRIPVRIHLTKIPEGIKLRVGTTASVLVRTETSEP